MLSAKATRKALLDANVVGVKSERSFRRYIDGSYPWPPDIRLAVEKLLGASELATGHEEAAPPWAERLTREIKDDLRAQMMATQDVVVGAVANRAAEATGQALGPHLQQLLDVLARLDERLGE